MKFAAAVILLLLAAPALAHPEGFSGLRILIWPDRTRAVLTLAALLSAIACADDGKGGPTSPDTAEAQTVALVELEGTRPAFYVQKADGSRRTRIHFTGAVDEVAGNTPLVPALTDANILALR